jgi:hypothetical protein
MPKNLHTGASPPGLTVMARLFGILALVCGCGLGTDVIELAPTTQACSGADCPANCRRASDLRDDFDDGVRGAAWGWSGTTGDGVLSEVGGELVLQPGRTRPGGASLTTSRSFALTSSHLTLEVTRMLAPSPIAWFQLQALTHRDDRLRMYVQQGVLGASYLERGGSAVELSSTPYLPAEHRYWRVREDAGTVHWEASRDGTTWHAIASAAVGFSLDWVHVQLEAGTNGAPGDLGAVHVDNLDLVGEPGFGDGGFEPCPIASAFDDFSDGERGGLWEFSTVSDDAHAEERDGLLVLAPPTGQAGEAAYGSANPFDARGGAAVIQVRSTLASAAGLRAELQLADEASSFAAIVQREGRIACLLGPGGSAQQVGETAYTAAAHLFWRLREAGGTLHCEMSADGQDYAALGSGPSPFDASRVFVTIRAASTAAHPAPGELAIEAFNP